MRVNRHSNALVENQTFLTMVKVKKAYMLNICMYGCIHTYIHTYKHTIHVIGAGSAKYSEYVNMHICMSACACMNASTHACMHVRHIAVPCTGHKNAPIYIYIYMYMYMYIYI